MNKKGIVHQQWHFIHQINSQKMVSIAICIQREGNKSTRLLMIIAFQEYRHHKMKRFHIQKL